MGSLVAKHVTKDKWDALKNIKTKTSGFTLIQAIACAVQFNNQHCGIYAGDWDSYKDFAPVFDPLIQEYHGISATAKHTSDMDVDKIQGNVVDDAPVHSCRIRVGRSIDGFGLSPGITKEQRVGVEKLMISAVKNFPEDLAGEYYPLTGMNEAVRQQLVAWRGTGLRVVASSTTKRRPSSSGSMRRISSASSPCRRVEMSRESLPGLPRVSRRSRTQSRRSPARTSAWMRSMVMSTPAPPTWVLA